MNQVALIGRIATEIELKYLKDGTAVANFNLAIDGYKDETYFFEIVCWGNTAENTAEYMSKGREVGISGELQQDKWQNDDGYNRSKVKVNARQVKFLSGSDNSNQQSSQQNNQQNQSGQQEQKQEQEDNGQVESDVDIPF